MDTAETAGIAHQITVQIPLERNQYFYEATVGSIYDGDTVRLNIDLGFSMWIINTSVRLAGIDAPEVRGLERPEGLKSRDYLSTVIPPGSVVFIKTAKGTTEKYGRYLATILLPDGTNINMLMIEMGYAAPYNP